MGIESHAMVPVRASISRSDVQHVLHQIRVVCDKIVGSDPRNGAFALHSVSICSCRKAMGSSRLALACHIPYFWQTS